jgi:hypothetical protein
MRRTPIVAERELLDSNRADAAARKLIKGGAPGSAETDHRDGAFWHLPFFLVPGLHRPRLDRDQALVLKTPDAKYIRHGHKIIVNADDQSRNGFVSAPNNAMMHGIGLPGAGKD